MHLIADNAKTILNVEPYDKIHRITFLKNKNNSFSIACAAGREILLTEIINNQFRDGFLTKFNDWISSIKYLNDGSIVAVTSHNFAVHLEIKDNRLTIKEKIKCDENSTLYCSHIHGENWSDLTFFAGIEKFNQINSN